MTPPASLHTSAKQPQTPILPLMAEAAPTKRDASTCGEKDPKILRAQSNTRQYQQNNSPPDSEKPDPFPPSWDCSYKGQTKPKLTGNPNTEQNRQIRSDQRDEVNCRGSSSSSRNDSSHYSRGKSFISSNRS